MKTYEAKRCVSSLEDPADHATINTKECIALDNFAKVKVSGSYGRQLHRDAQGATIADGTQKSDGYWFDYGGKRYQLYRQP